MSPTSGFGVALALPPLPLLKPHYGPAGRRQPAPRQGRQWQLGRLHLVQSEQAAENDTDSFGGGDVPKHADRERKDN